MWSTTNFIFQLIGGIASLIFSILQIPYLKDCSVQNIGLVLCWLTIIIVILLTYAQLATIFKCLNCFSFGLCKCIEKKCLKVFHWIALIVAIVSMIYLYMESDSHNELRRNLQGCDTTAYALVTLVILIMMAAVVTVEIVLMCTVSKEEEEEEKDPLMIDDRNDRKTQIKNNVLIY